MDKMKKFIDILVPVTNCNLNCHYCYITQTNYRDSQKMEFKYSPEYIGNALTIERLGGICHFNVCGLGETLLPKEMPEIIKNLLKQGHYLMIVTNGLLTKRINTLLELPDDYLIRLGFKFSFHYLELLRTNQMNIFFENVRRVQAAGCSFSVELTPSDELLEHRDDIKEVMLRELGALCHITIPRAQNEDKIPLLSKYNLKDFIAQWDEFDSDLLHFKATTWGIKRKEYCHAGLWSGQLNIGTGLFSLCYSNKFTQNIFEDLSKPIKFMAVGKNCKLPHCFNSHALLSLGLIPEIGGYRYSQLRNRIDDDGNEWLNIQMKDFLNSRLCENNPPVGIRDKAIFNYYKLTTLALKAVNRLKK